MLLTAFLALAKPDEETPFSVTPFGFVVPSFTWIANDPASLTAQDGFQVNARIGAQAEFDDPKLGKVGAKLELELTPEPQLRDGFAYWKPASFLKLELGQIKVPYAVGYIAADTRRLLPATPQAFVDATGRDLGLTVTAGLPIAEKRRAALVLGVYNGEGANRLQNVNERFKYAVRGVITPFGARDSAFEGSDGTLYLGIGGGWVYNWVGADLSSEEQNYFGGDVQFAWNVLSVQGEFLLGQHAFANAAVADYNQVGWYTTVASYIPVAPLREHVQLVARYGEAEPDDSFVGSWSGQVAPFAREITGGVNVYWLTPPKPFHDLKLQVAYTTFQELEGDNFLNNKLTTAVVVRF